MGRVPGLKVRPVRYPVDHDQVALAAWTGEKFRTRRDCDGDVERSFTKDELLANITIYQAAQTIGSSTRLYYESQRVPWSLEEGEGIRVAGGCRLPERDQPPAAGMG